MIEIERRRGWLKVCAGFDPVWGMRHYLDAVVPAGPRTAAEADEVRTRLLREIDEDQLRGEVDVRAPQRAQLAAPSPARRRPPGTAPRQCMRR